MKSTYTKKIYILLLVAFMLIILVCCKTPLDVFQKSAALSTNEGEDRNNLKKLNLTIFLWQSLPFNEPVDDVVGRAIEEKTNWRINVTEWLYESGQNWSEKLNLFVASKTLPDVFEFPASGVDTIEKYSDLFVDMSPYIMNKTRTPYVHEYLDDKTIERMKTFHHKKIIYWPTELVPDYSQPAIREEFKDDLYNSKTTEFVISIREDILKELGYDFIPVKELQQEIESNNRRLTYEDIKIEPEIRTFDDLEELLINIKNLDLKAADGSPVIPYGGFDQVLQFGGAFAFNFFRFIDGECMAYYGSPYAKEMFKMLNRWYRMGLLDKDSYVYAQQREKISEKIASGKLACWNGAWLPREQEVEEELREHFPDAYTRYIPIPIYREEIPPYFDGLTPGPMRGILIDKEYENIELLIEYLDWLWSDEAQELIMWGTENNGVWEMKDGKRVFKDDDLRRSILLGGKTLDGRDANYYGLFSGFYQSPYVRALNNNNLNPYNYRFSYPVEYELRSEMKRAAGASMISIDGTLQGPRGEEAGKVNNFFWSESWNLHGRVILASTEEEFEQQYQGLLDKFMANADYEKAIEDMTTFYDENR